VLLLGARRTRRTIKAEYCHRGNIIGESHRVLSSGNIKKVLPLGEYYKRKLQGATTGNTSYGAYDIDKVLLSGKYYKRKPQNAAIGGSYKRKLLKKPAP